MCSCELQYQSAPIPPLVGGVSARAHQYRQSNRYPLIEAFGTSVVPIRSVEDQARLFQIDILVSSELEGFMG